MNSKIIEDIKNSLKPLVDLNKELLTNSVIFDIGSNVGLFTLILIENKIKYEQIHLFEPCKDYFTEGLKTLNGYSGLVFNNFALGSENKEEIIYKCNNGNIGWNTILTVDPNQEKGFHNSLDKENIIIKRLDDYTVEKLDFIKIDVEGYEAEVIDGGLETIKKFKPYILVEVAWGKNHPFWEKNKNIYKKLFEIGYKEVDLNFSITKDILFEPLQRLLS